ncbi:Hypothetical protein ING2D1G_0685 [Peptoniphilus sp. ING2-D1G]|nr:Hypothetical protein ING2D1G_0685 [Peptoniphilus sp. ING2-D1G]
MKNYFKEIKNIEDEQERLIKEYKKAEILFYKADNIFDKEELRLNMIDIQSKIDNLKFEKGQVMECLENMINQGIMI